MSTLKEAIRKARLRKNGGADDIKAFLTDVTAARVEELFSELLDEMRTMGIEELKKIAATIKKGDKGDAGKDGKDGRSITGPAGKSIRGPAGPAGKSIRGPAGLQGNIGKDGTEIKKSELLKKINTIDNGIEITTIKGLDAYLNNLKRAIREKTIAGKQNKHGGGMTLDAGSNITLTRTSDGRWTIAASSSSGLSIATERVTAVQSGTDVTIDLTQLAHTYSGVLIVTRNGQVLMPNGSVSLPGSSWSQSSNTVTVYNADASEIFLVQYSYA